MLLEDFLKQFDGLDPKTEVYRWWNGNVKKLDVSSFDSVQFRYVDENDIDKDFISEFKCNRDFPDEEMIIVIP